MKVKTKVRIIPIVDENGWTCWCVHPEDRVVRELPILSPSALTEKQVRRPKKRGKR